MFREDIDIEGIANTLGLFFYEDKDWKCIVMDLVLKYRHGPYNNEWKRSGITDEELFVMLKQTVAGALSLSGIMTTEKAFTFIVGLLLVKKDIKAWRANYMAAEYNRELEKTLAALK